MHWNIAYDSPFHNRYLCSYAPCCYKMVHCGVWDWCICTAVWDLCQKTFGWTNPWQFLNAVCIFAVGWFELNNFLCFTRWPLSPTAKTGLHFRAVNAAALVHNLFASNSHQSWRLGMMKSSHGILFHVTGPLCREFNGHRWIPLTKASDAELWYFLCSVPKTTTRVNNRDAGDLRRHRPHYDATVLDIYGSFYGEPFISNCSYLNTSFHIM